MDLDGDYTLIYRSDFMTQSKPVTYHPLRVSSRITESPLSEFKKDGMTVVGYRCTLSVRQV